MCSAITSEIHVAFISLLIYKEKENSVDLAFSAPHSLQQVFLSLFLYWKILKDSSADSLHDGNCSDFANILLLQGKDYFQYRVDEHKSSFWRQMWKSYIVMAAGKLSFEQDVVSGLVPMGWGLSRDKRG